MKELSWVLAIVAVATGSWGSPVHAQEAVQTTSPTVTGSVASVAEKRLPAMRFTQTPLREVLSQIAKASGVWIMADSSVGGVLVTMQLPAGTVMDAMTTLKPLLPETAKIRRVAIPTTEAMPLGDTVAQYLMAQDALTRTAKRETQETKGSGSIGEIEVMGQSLPLEKATPLMAGLNLTPAYLFTNPNSDTVVGKALQMQAEGLQLWMEMTPEQRAQVADSQLNNLLNMDPAARQALFGQMQQQAVGMMQKIQALPPDQRAQFWKDVTGGRWDGTTPPPRGGNGGVGGGRP